MNLNGCFNMNNKTRVIHKVYVKSRVVDSSFIIRKRTGNAFKMH